MRWINNLFLLPIRTFLYGMGMMVETLRGIERMAEESLGHPTPEMIHGELPEPSWVDISQQLVAEPFRGEQEHVKEEQAMSDLQDLGDDKMVKVVQYCIVSVVSGVTDTARVLVGPSVIAFSDAMTAEDFTAWIIAENCPKEHTTKNEHTKKDDHSCSLPGIEKGWDRKYLRVAFTVMGRFRKADIDWEELQAISVARIAEKLNGPGGGESGAPGAAVTAAKKPS